MSGAATTVAPFVCPRCKGPLDYTTDAYRCDACALRFPVLCGIPDFRLAPDRYITIDDDRRKGQRLFEEAARRDFAGMLDYYYSITPEVPPDLARKFTAHALAEVEIGEATLAELPGDWPRGGGPEGSGSTAQPGSLPPCDPLDIGRSGSLPAAAGSTAHASALPRGGDLDAGGSANLSPQVPPGGLLDVGCSTGGLVAAAARRFPFVAGVDAAFRWLVVGVARLREAGVGAPLVCANAQFLPFPDDSFAVLTATDLIEHLIDPAPVFGECRRVAAPGGVVYFSTNNRYSLALEPHVNVWGVGWLPRGLQAGYVRLAAGRAYRNITLRSAAELERWAGAARFDRARAEPAPLALPHRLEDVQAAYNRYRRGPACARLLRRIGPRLQLLCRK